MVRNGIELERTELFDPKMNGTKGTVKGTDQLKPKNNYRRYSKLEVVGLLFASCKLSDSNPGQLGWKTKCYLGALLSLIQHFHLSQ